jgi:hypothetical protein
MYNLFLFVQALKKPNKARNAVPLKTFKGADAGFNLSGDRI